jgi:hypothetical protein
MTVILVTQEAQIRRISFQSQPWKVRPYFEKKITKMYWQSGSISWSTCLASVKLSSTLGPQKKSVGQEKLVYEI